MWQDLLSKAMNQKGYFANNDDDDDKLFSQ
jgi:hypothetical protein